MYYVYFLQSLKTQKLYYGYTHNLKHRIQQHNAGKNFSTAPYRPYRLVYYEAYADKRDAQIREQRLKKFGQGIYRLKERLRYSLKTKSM